ncbi:MAG: reverse transcriptase domain-containing protein [Aeromonas sp.]
MNLRESALSWASEALKIHLNNLTVAQLYEALIKRFGGMQDTDLMLSRFITSPYPSNRDDYTKFLNEATVVFLRGYMNVKPLMEMVINKSPSEIRIELLRVAEATMNWDEFIKRANEISWLSFPDPSLNVVQKSDNVNTIKAAKIKWCFWHETNTHKTEECTYLIKKKKLRKEIRNAKEKKVVAIKQKTEVEEEENNKNYLSYINTFSTDKNPFFIDCYINNIRTKCLIDTGADRSILHHRFITRHDLFKKKGLVKLKSACGRFIETIGGIDNIVTRIGTKNYKVSYIIVQDEPSYPILGTDFICKFPNILIDLLDTLNVYNCKKDIKIATIEQTEKFYKEKYKSLFSENIQTNKPCSSSKHIIKVSNNQPIANRNGRIPICFEAEIDKEINKLYKLGIIRDSESDWCNRIVPIRKRDGTLRMCLDFRPLNAVTVLDRYPIPRIDEIYDKLSRAKIFTTLDATSGYHQIELDECSKKYTAFSWKGGFYEYNRMCFGLCNAPATYQRTMDKMFRNENHDFVIPYFDDIIIFSNNEEEHVLHIEKVLKILKENNIILKESKCQFFKKEIKILGNIISNGTIKPDPTKISTINNFTKPQNIQQLRSFLGLVNYCREYIPNLAALIAPLSDILKGESKRSQKVIKWNPTNIATFNKVKEVINKETSRIQPDFKKPFIVTTDASEVGIGAILSQKCNGTEKMICAFSKKLDKHQQNYSTTDKELLALVKGIENFRHYLLGGKFLLRTDHKALSYLQEAKDLKGRMQRWALSLQEYTFDIEYVQGDLNIADGYSRLSRVSCFRSKLNTKKLITEKSTINEIIMTYHKEIGHASASNMKFNIARKYHWKTMFKDIDNYVKACQICNQAGREKINTKSKFIKVNNDKELWEIDLIGRIPSDNANVFIIVAINHYNKWVESRVIKNKTKENVIAFIKQNVIDKHGAPKRILSDIGKEFNNKDVQQFATNEGIRWEFAAKAHHKTVGCVERANQTLWNIIRRMSKFGETNWMNTLKQATLAMNMSFNRAIGTSPYVFKYMKYPMLPIDKKLGVSEKIIEKQILNDERDRIHTKYSKEFTTGRECDSDFKIGDKVFIYEKRLSDKIKSEWHAGYEVICKTGRESWKVGKGRKLLILNKCHIKH